MLVFTQFREITGPLAAHLGAVFGRPGLVLHGGTPVKARRDLVRQFQDDERVPFFVLSLKAGGSGLNLTAASHVIHFDRWWNPAVEDQATDRAFRIGQTRNVLVHKFVCRGTVEERIDELIASKRGLARDLLEGGADLLLTEMKDDELLRLVALDVERRAQGGMMARRRRTRTRSAATTTTTATADGAASRRTCPVAARKAQAARKLPEPAEVRAHTCRPSRSPAARSRRRSGAARGATTWSATRTTPTASPAAGPTCATGR